MNNLTIILGIVYLFTSCEQNEIKKDLGSRLKQEIVKESKDNKKITFNKVKGRAIVLGSKIRLLDDNFKEIRDITFLNEHFVEVKEVSEQFYNSDQTDNYCQKFKYVKIKKDELEGYVDGRNLYEPIKHIQNRFVKINDNVISFIKTRNFGVEELNKDGVSVCEVNTPVIFSDKNANYEGLLKMVEKNNFTNWYPYFKLENKDGARDEIQQVNKESDKKYILKIKSIYQHGESNLLISIYRDENKKFVAEVLKNEQTKK